MDIVFRESFESEFRRSSGGAVRGCPYLEFPLFHYGFALKIVERKPGGGERESDDTAFPRFQGYFPEIL